MLVPAMITVQPSRLTEREGREIKRRYTEDPHATQENLATEYGVSRTVIRRVLNGAIVYWKPE